MAISRITHYFDYKSPYAYLAQEETFALADEFGIVLDVLPYTLDIPSYLGAAQLDAAGRDILNARNPHQWRRVKYSYMDCRREATRRGLVLRGPRKIFDSSVAHIGMLYAKRAGDFRPYHDLVYERFWKRELEDIEQPAVVQALLAEVGVEAAGFAAYLAGEGRAEHDRIRGEAERQGVFGVPSYMVDGELFWGNERIVRVRERLAAS
ncbi:MAG: DsbA family protein [Candidatus Lambdaproteobacteria bacterium]|nr:DsbA family protein [Candidatus Lambdaproteobacteria bacterium]